MQLCPTDRAGYRGGSKQGEVQLVIPTERGVEDALTRQNVTRMIVSPANWQTRPCQCLCMPISEEVALLFVNNEYRIMFGSLFIVLIDT